MRVYVWVEVWIDVRIEARVKIGVDVRIQAGMNVRVDVGRIHVGIRDVVIVVRNYRRRRGSCHCWVLHIHTGILEHVRPFPTQACVAMFEVLSEVVRTVEFLLPIALLVFVEVDEMFETLFPIWGITIFLAAISANVYLYEAIRSLVVLRR